MPYEPVRLTGEQLQGLLRIANEQLVSIENERYAGVRLDEPNMQWMIGVVVGVAACLRRMGYVNEARLVQRELKRSVG